MASGSFEITISNRFKDANFFLFQEIPSTENDSSGPIHSNVIQATGRVQAAGDGSSTVEFVINNQYCAIIGRKTGRGGGGQCIITQNYRNVRLGPGGSTVAVGSRGGYLQWDDNAAAGRVANAEGGFQILTTSDVSGRGDDYIGVGMRDPESDKVIPVASFLTEPNLNVTIIPRQVYYVAVGERQQGEIVDPNSVGRRVKIDFAESRTPRAFLTVDNNGQWKDGDNASLNNGVRITSRG